jgi:hypothetical protein
VPGLRLNKKRDVISVKPFRPDTDGGRRDTRVFPPVLLDLHVKEDIAWKKLRIAKRIDIFATVNVNK